MRMNVLFIVAALFAVVAPAKPMIAQDGAMTSEQMKKEWPGHTVITPRTYVYYEADGTMRAEMKDGSASDTGTYRFTEDNMYCSKWSRWRGGEETCVRYKKVGETKFLSLRPDGTTRNVFEKVKGNPHNL